MRAQGGAVIIRVEAWQEAVIVTAVGVDVAVIAALVVRQAT